MGVLEPNLKKDSKCYECMGTGIVPCELCGGTGKWRALNKTRMRDKYTFVECPQCFGKGVKVCGACFGSGLGNVKGFFRRTEITPLIDRMQNGEILPDSKFTLNI